MRAPPAGPQRGRAGRYSGSGGREHPRRFGSPVLRFPGSRGAGYTPAGMDFFTASARSGSTLTSGAYFPGTVTSTLTFRSTVVKR